MSVDALIDPRLASNAQPAGTNRLIDREQLAPLVWRLRSGAPALSAAGGGEGAIPAGDVRYPPAHAASSRQALLPPSSTAIPPGMTPPPTLPPLFAEEPCKGGLAGGSGAHHTAAVKGNGDGMPPTPTLNRE